MVLSCTHWSQIVGLVIAAAITVLVYFGWIYNHWSSRNVPYLRPRIPFGNISSPFTRTQPFSIDVANYYHKMKNLGHKHAGLFIAAVPTYLPIDPEFVKNIMSKDFTHFVNRGVFFNERDDPLSAHLFAIEDDKWRHLRSKLTPTFTSGKMKAMFQTLLDCGLPLSKEIARLHAAKQPLDIKELVACYTTDIIGSCAFGIECNSFKNPDADFRKHGRLIFRNTFTQGLKRMLVISAPQLARKIRMTFINRNVHNFFLEVVRKTVTYREESGIHRNDVMQLLIDLKNENGLNGTPLSIEQIAAQSFTFFAGGFETSSTTMAYCMYELAQYPEIQDKLRKEIDEVILKHAAVTYESLSEMKYLSQVIDETLRKYPPLPILNRICTKDYKVPDTDVKLEKGTRVFISTYGLHHDAQYYPDPEKFNPDRFSEENKANLVPYTYLPFGEGPRNCIGLRFAMMQTKVGLITILHNYKLRLNSKTPKKVSLHPDSFILANLETIYLDVENI